jgi:putative ABC transport system ATP-binding protein
VEKKVIELKEVWKVYNLEGTKVEALRGLNLSIKKGEFAAVQGPSGSGKSTAFNMIGCLDIPTKGKIFLDGYDTSKLTENELARIRGKKIGFIFQTFNLMPSMSALENVAMPLIFQNDYGKETLNRAKILLNKVGLGHRINHNPGQLSGGERQRVAIARALINNPELILADEPTGNLDSKNGDIIMNILENLNKEGKTIIMVTHEKVVSAHAHRIIRIKDGRVEK